MFTNTLTVRAPKASVAHFDRLLQMYLDSLERNAQGRFDLEVEGRVTGVERRLFTTRLTYTVEIACSKESLVEAMVRDLLDFASRV